MKKVLSFAFEKETKGAVRYHEIDKSGKVLESPDEYVVGTLYVRKHVLDAATGIPKRLKLVISDKETE